MTQQRMSPCPAPEVAFPIETGERKDPRAGFTSEDSTSPDSQAPQGAKMSPPIVAVPELTHPGNLQAMGLQSAR